MTHSHTHICIFYIQALYNCTATENVTLFYIFKKKLNGRTRRFGSSELHHSDKNTTFAFTISHEEWEHATLIKA